MLVIAVLVMLLAAAGTMYAGDNALRKDAVYMVHSTALGLGGLLSKVEDRETQLILLKEFVHKSRFFPKDCGYFFIINREGVCLAHGTQPEMEGKTILHTKDIEGAPLTQRMIEEAETGGGFFEYMWQKPGSKKAFRKLGYVEPIPGTPYIIGTGVYFPTPW
ncbi:cache domain-containing protein [Pseudodesulfovibrio cashew]|nr:cache domain-containing protein [Pseudodesulfovibrio cashew]